ncbi:hypothetical protein BC936DRAFT_147198 [Jimgerdemannia flammicorona]|uniref:Fe2OG dioxygenase domain-containing protein n=1 Tax=Jimgerdemannia flammicorona TaxID=994334 RepID=A0A433D5W4_9FUNG|nr:hypothetical protein BC936DRAFT_147198 [Jimgerdemannia flammicorona]RUP46221.1 hypothetical protein BC936DRAFT_147198 [Jimgerdemannia flammicorona]
MTIDSNAREPLSLPILDYSLLQSNDPDAQSGFISELRSALLDSGFFYLTNHGIPLQELDSLFDVLKRFFTLPLEIKEEIAMEKSPHFRGYTRLGEEITDFKADNREELDYAPERASLRPLPATSPIYQNLHGPNQWPDEALVPGFRDGVLRFQARANDVALAIMSAIARSLELSPRFFEEAFGEKSHNRLKLVRYPAAGETGVQGHGLGVGPHKDGGYLTMLFQDAVGGLQIQTRMGSWLSATPIRGTAVINIGQQLERLTKRVYVSTTHRVLTHSHSERFSVPFFLCPHLDAVIPEIDVPAWILDRAREHHEWTSDVPTRELLQREVYGENAWRGITRSHVGVLCKHYPEEAKRRGYVH